MRVLIVGWTGNALSAISSVRRSTHEIGLVVLPKDKKTAEINAFCDANKISHCIVGKRGLARVVASAKPDVLVSAACPWILPREIWENTLCINVHSSLLPKYRGPHPINWTLINGEVETGVTVHLIDRPGVDNGPIILQRKTPIDSWDNARTVGQRLVALGGSLLVKALGFIEAEGTEVGGVNSTAYTEQSESEATLAPKRTPEMGKIDWHSLNARQAYNLIRALVDPYPNAFCANARTGNRVEFQGASVMVEAGNGWGEPGEVLGVKNGGKYLLAAAEGTLLVTTEAKLTAGDILK